MKDERKTKAELIKEVKFLREQVTDISTSSQGRKSSEWELRLYDIYQHAPVAYYCVSAKDRRILQCNQKAEELLGYHDGKLLGKNLNDIYADHPEGKQKAARLFNRFLAGISISNEEMVMQRADGSPIWVSLSVEPVKNKEGKVIESRSTVIDITDQKKKQRLLEIIQQSHEFYLQNAEAKPVFTFLLKKMVELTDSEYGFLDEVLTDEKGHLYKLSLALSDISWDEDSKRLYNELIARNLEFRNLANLAGAPAVFDKVIIANDAPQSTHSGGIPKGHPHLYSFMGIPLHFGGELVGVAGVANRPGGYGEEMVEFLAPFLSTCSSILYAVRQKKKEQEHLRQIEETTENLSAILNATPESAFLTDPEGIVLDGNNIFAARVGKRKSDLIGENIFDHIPTKVRETRRAQVLKMIQSKKTLEFEDIRNGRAYSNRLFPIFDSKGNLVRIAVFAADITDQRSADRELIESEIRFRALADYSPAGIYETDDQGKCTFVNKRWCEMAGLSFEEAIGENWIEGVHLDDRELVLSKWESMVESKGKWTLEYRFQNQEGVVTWVSGMATPRYNEKGKLVGYIGVNTDITDRIDAENGLKINQERYKGLFHHSPIPTWEEDFSSVKKKFDELKKKGVEDFRKYFDEHPEQIFALAGQIRIVDVNLASLQFFGVASIDELYRHLPNYFIEESWPTVKDEIIALANGDNNFSAEIEIQNLQKERLTLSLHLSVSPGCEKTLSQVLVSFIDLSDRKKAEALLRDREQQLETVNLALEQKNLTLRELIEQIKFEKERIELNIQRSIETLISPVISQMEDRIPSSMSGWMELLKSNVDQLTTSKSARLSIRLQHLSKREIEICNLIQKGKTTKEIADFLNLSPRSIDAHRNRIRKKLGISNTNVSLSAFLQQESNT